MPFDFDQAVPRENTDSVKYDLREKLFGREDIIPMWVADMDFRVPPAVSQAIHERANHGIYGYSIRPEGFYDSAISWMDKRHGWQVARDWLTFSPGIVPGVNLAIMGLTAPGDKIMIQPPVYFPFFDAIKKNDRQLAENRLILRNGRYYVDLEDFERQLQGGVRMFILSNPHNPGGSVWTRQELEDMGNLCLQYGATIIADEIHCDIVFPGYRYTPMASISEEIASQTLTFIAPSKTFNIAGLSTSVGIISDSSLRREFNRMLDRIHIGHGNIFGTVALQAAYNHGGEWLDQLLVYLKQNLELIEHYIHERLDGVKLIRPEGTYLAWLDCRELPLENDRINRFMIEQAGVGLNDGASFGENGQGFQRLNFGCPRSTLQKVLENLDHAIRNI
ncbi:MAG: PatB family C-S lyase [Bacteroidales bacterium]|nr:PatB family C-S lyase [Bacteroidales bacterium]